MSDAQDRPVLIGGTNGPVQWIDTNRDGVDDRTQQGVAFETVADFSLTESMAESLPSWLVSKIRSTPERATPHMQLARDADLEFRGDGSDSASVPLSMSAGYEAPDRDNDGVRDFVEAAYRDKYGKTYGEWGYVPEATPVGEDTTMRSTTVGWPSVAWTNTPHPEVDPIPQSELQSDATNDTASGTSSSSESSSNGGSSSSGGGLGTGSGSSSGSSESSASSSGLSTKQMAAGAAIAVAAAAYIYQQS